jgi:hypothetical protein
MSDLTDRELRNFYNATDIDYDKLVDIATRLAEEVKRHRAAVHRAAIRADRERVMAVVRDACTAGATNTVIATRVADALASPARTQIDTTKLLSSTTEADWGRVRAVAHDAICEMTDVDETADAIANAIASPAISADRARVYKAASDAFTTVVFPHNDDSITRADWNELRAQVANLTADAIVGVKS